MVCGHTVDAPVLPRCLWWFALTRFADQHALGIYICMAWIHVAAHGRMTIGFYLHRYPATVCCLPHSSLLKFSMMCSTAVVSSHFPGRAIHQRRTGALQAQSPDRWSLLYATWCTPSWAAICASLSRGSVRSMHTRDILWRRSMYSTRYRSPPPLAACHTISHTLSRGDTYIISIPNKHIPRLVSTQLHIHSWSASPKLRSPLLSADRKTDGFGPHQVHRVITERGAAAPHISGISKQRRLVLTALQQ